MFHDFTPDFQTYKDTSFINLNNGTLGLCPSSVIDQQKAELEIFERNTSYGLGSSWSRIWKIQEGLGEFLKASPQDLFLRPNVTLALNEIIMSLPLPPSSEILTTNFEYGAVVNILKHKVKRDGLKLRTENVDFLYKDITPDEFVKRMMAFIGPETKVLVISHIFTGNGIEIPLKPLAKALRSQGVLLVVDGAHAPGLVSLDFKNELCDVDFYAGNLHKWFMGPKGTAFAWVHKDHQDKTIPLYGSWTTEPDVPKDLKEFASHGEFATKMLWSHSQSFSSYYGLESCLKFWKKHSSQTIQTEIGKRMQYLQEKLQDMGLKPVKALQASVPAKMLGYQLDRFPKAVFQNIMITSDLGKLQVGLPKLPGAALIRLTPHIHNTQKELDQAVEILRSCR